MGRVGAEGIWRCVAIGRLKWELRHVTTLVERAVVALGVLGDFGWAAAGGRVRIGGLRGRG